MKKRVVFLAILLLALLSTGVAQADILFNNFGAGDTYDTSFGWTVSGSTSQNPQFEPAMSFTPSTTAHLSSIDFVTSMLSGTNEVMLSLVNDSGGAPLGLALESWTFINQMGTLGSNPSVLTADSVVHPLLDVGTTYWLVASPPVSDTWAGWNFNSIGDTGTVLFSLDGGAGWGTLGYTEPITRGVFRVNSTAVPEPSTFLLLGAGLAGVGLLRRRFKNSR
ncbi:exported hypothetical protein [Candidatus Sulfobium mesophilum]|uniref:Ice-binding protein C-terminal domain-containing protein n=1 Tax=Candidatus Sulfobium mesophilum TaxID=2016548 RepID=A0A2U3QE18_9BACT|nr:exported hypothetical protein [Candidatus Sulfobium mesophilum]